MTRYCPNCGARLDGSDWRNGAQDNGGAVVKVFFVAMGTLFFVLVRLVSNG
jgi:hypothetical protein